MVVSIKGKTIAKTNILKINSSVIIIYQSFTLVWTNFVLSEEDLTYESG